MLIRRSPHEAWREPAVSALQNEDTLQLVLESAPEHLPGFVGTRLVTEREISTRYGQAMVLPGPTAWGRPSDE
jgi:hypothetical protein